MLKKILMVTGIVILVLVLIVALGKDIIAKTAITTGVKAITGLKLSIKSMKVGIITTMVGINEMKLYNPQGFTDPLMVDIPEIYVDYDLGAFLKKEIHLKEVRLDLKEFMVVKDKDGKLNLDSLKAVQTAKEEEPEKQEEKAPAKKQEKPKIRIDLLKLKIGKVIYKDYSKSPEKPSVREFNVNIDAQYENITDPEALARIIVVKALANTTISSLTNFDLGPITDSLKGGLKNAGDLVTNVTGKTLDVGKDVGEKTLDTAKESLKSLNKLLPFKKK